jgi:hypothetical protein
MHSIIRALAFTAWLGAAGQAISAPSFVPEFGEHRSGIERTQSSSAGGRSYSEKKAEGRGAGQPRQRRGNRQQENGGGRSNEAPRPPHDPPGCLYRKGPLDLIV